MICNITILAGLPFVALRTEARVVADADSGVLTRRVALRFGVKNEPDCDTAGRVRTRGHESEHTGDEQNRGTETHKAHGRSLERSLDRDGGKGLCCAASPQKLQPQQVSAGGSVRPGGWLTVWIRAS